MTFERLFDICVDILYFVAEVFNVTYKEANIYIFVIIHPLITIVLLYSTLLYRKRCIKK